MYIEYKVEIKGLTSEQKIKLNSENGYIDYVTLQFSDKPAPDNMFEELYIRFYLRNTFDNVDKAKNITCPLVKNIFDLMIYKFSDSQIKLKHFMLNSHNIENKRLIGSAEISLYHIQSHEITSEDTQWLESEVKSQTLINKLNTNLYFIKYRSISMVEDKVARYLLLYSLLYDIKGSQRSVDSYIRQREPKVKMCPSTKNSKKCETTYTWWRNQVEHMQKNTNINEVTKNIEDLVNPLNKLVFEAVKKIL